MVHPAPSFSQGALRLVALVLATLPCALSAAPASSHGGGSLRIVAELETRVPPLTEFLLRGTLPIPPGTYPRSDGKNPFTLLDFDGQQLVTQVEVVSRYPDASEGADVVELLARVRPDPNLAVGAPARYRVAFAVPEPRSLRPLPPVPNVVGDFLLDPAAIEIAAYDCFGNRYVSRPLGGMREVELLQRGALYGEARIHQVMVPEVEVPGSTLPHLLGVHAYVSWQRGSPQVGLNLRFHNGHDGFDKDDPLDDPLDKLYFERLELSLPETWVVQQDFVDPLFGAERVENGRRIVALVAPDPSGGLHVMRWLAQFHRRLGLTLDRPRNIAASRALLDGAGRAFAVRGFDRKGAEYWSWWNAETARFFPQRQRLPLLDHVGKGALEAELAGELAFLSAHLADGTGVGNYPIASGRLGWGHPYGVSYGGMTGGLEINLLDGIATAAAASQSGLRAFFALHRMHTDRQPNALYQKSGEPSSVDEWLVENGDLDFVPMEFFLVPQTFGSRPDPFGVRLAPRFQVDFVAANGLQPAYESAHLGFDPHDYQHFTRYTRSAKVLAWLANDSLAIDDLRLQAENFHLTFHEHASGANGVSQHSSLLSLERYVGRYPGKGMPYGRGEAWGLDCAAAAYSTASLAWRARKLPWFQRQAELLLGGQAACSGFIQAQVSSKAFEGRYRARQAIEQTITEHGLVALHESVFRGAHPAHADLTRDVLEASARAFISPMAWFPGEHGPWRYTGIGPLDPDLPLWCSQADMALDAWTVGDIDTYQDWSTFAYGFKLTGEASFLRFARFQTGGAEFLDLLARLEADGTENLANRAALLAVCQEVAGEF